MYKGRHILEVELAVLIDVGRRLYGRCVLNEIDETGEVGKRNLSVEVYVAH